MSDMEELREDARWQKTWQQEEEAKDYRDCTLCNDPHPSAEMLTYRVDGGKTVRVCKACQGDRCCPECKTVLVEYDRTNQGNRSLLAMSYILSRWHVHADGMYECPDSNCRAVSIKERGVLTVIVDSMGRLL